MENKSLLKRFLVWRLKHLNHKQFIYVLSIIIGLISGVIERNYVRSKFIPKETVATMMRAPLGVLSAHNTMEEVTAIFKDTGAWNLPVLKKGKYVGYISKSKLFSIYRRHLLEVSED